MKSRLLATIGQEKYNLLAKMTANTIKDLDRLAIDESTHTAAIQLTPRTLKGITAEQFVRKNRLDENPFNSYLILEGHNTSSIAYHMEVDSPNEYVGQFLHASIHTCLSATVFTYGLRCRDLLATCNNLINTGEIISLAVCTRSLFESVCAFYSASKSLYTGWAEHKRKWKPVKIANENIEATENLVSYFNTTNTALFKIMHGGKYDQKAPQMQSMIGEATAQNVLSSVEKISKLISKDLSTHYQVLCNVAHPSHGTHFSYASPPLMHQAKTHFIHYYCYGKIDIRSMEDQGKQGPQQILIETSTAALLYTSAALLSEILRLSVYCIDDFILTTKSGKLPNFDYWRSHKKTKPESKCPCGSGKAIRFCNHKWGKELPPFKLSEPKETYTLLEFPEDLVS